MKGPVGDNGRPGRPGDRGIDGEPGRPGFPGNDGERGQRGTFACAQFFYCFILSNFFEIFKLIKEGNIPS